jgi:plastocyanin
LLAGAIGLGIAAGALNAQLAQAQEAETQTFTVMAGAAGPGNMDVLSFAPASIQVHRGDTVTWMINGFHNVHLTNEPQPLAIPAEVDGQQTLQVNPAVAFPNTQSGASFTGGDANSGLPMPGTPPIFSLVMDVEPGTYSYLCDVHPGMVGTITVVADDQPIPRPEEVAAQGATELGGTIGAAIMVNNELEMRSPEAEDGSTVVLVGSNNTGRATLNQFFPFSAVINAGESVTFLNDEGSVEPHTVSWPPVRGQDFVPAGEPVEGQPPMLVVGPGIAPMTESGATVGNGDAFSSGFFGPGQSFTLTFSEPGVYNYTCNIHPGMNGVIIVQ